MKPERKTTIGMPKVLCFYRFLSTLIVPIKVQYSTTNVVEFIKIFFGFII